MLSGKQSYEAALDYFSKLAIPYSTAFITETGDLCLSKNGHEIEYGTHSYWVSYSIRLPNHNLKYFRNEVNFVRLNSKYHIRIHRIAWFLKWIVHSWLCLLQSLHLRSGTSGLKITRNQILALYHWWTKSQVSFF